MNNKKRIVLVLAAVILLSVFAVVFAGCGNDDGPLSTEEVKKVVLNDLNVKESKVESIHIHPSNVNDTPCYYVYITAEGRHWEYTVDGFTGSILGKMESDQGHSH